MNKFIVAINAVSFSVIDNLPETVFSTWLLYTIVICFSAWLINKSKVMLSLSLVFTLLFSILFAYNYWMTAQQTKMIVYNVPQHQAIDFVSGDNYQFVGDSVLLADAMLQNFHLKPGRIEMQVSKREDSLACFFKEDIFYQFGDKRIVVIDKPLDFIAPANKIKADIIIISKSPKLYIPQLAGIFNCNQYVFDASNSLWKIEKWKKDCKKLHLRSYSIPDEGAFILNVE